MANIPLKTLTFSGLDNVYTVVDPEEVDKKVNPDGNYDDLSAGSAKQLISDNYIEDKVPYLFRPSGDNGADRAFDTIVGGTIAWNQLANTMHGSYTNNGVTLTLKDGHGATITGTATANAALQISNALIPLSKDHVYLIPNVEGFTGSSVNRVTLSGLQLTGYNGGLFKNTGNYGNVYLRIDFYANTVFNVQNYEYQLFDLTQMFGSTIADYVYSLDQATAGAGVAWFKKLFPNSYYPYNAGELMSVSGLQSHDTVEFNLWDEEWETGDINRTTGEDSYSSTQIRSKNYISVLPSTNYYIACLDAKIQESNIALVYYDGNKNFISAQWGVNFIRRTPDNCCYIRFTSNSTYGATYKNDICINFSDPLRNGQYEPYKKHSYPLDSSLTLRGVPKLDSNNKLYYDGDTYVADGTVTRKYGIVDLGTLSWTHPSSNRSVAQINTAKPPVSISAFANCIAEKYIQVTGNLTLVDGTYAILGQNQNTYLYFYYDGTTVPSGYMVYEFATLTTETAEPYVNPQIVDPSGTEEYVTTSIVPVGHITKYPENIRAKIDGLPWDLSMIAPIDNGTTATRAYLTGQYFMHNNQLCKAKTSIASGATFTLNTNYEVTTVAAELYSALNS